MRHSIVGEEKKDETNEYGKIITDFKKKRHQTYSRYLLRYDLKY